MAPPSLKGGVAFVFESVFFYKVELAPESPEVAILVYKLPRSDMLYWLAALPAPVDSSSGAVGNEGRALWT
jgi:hypothetical protein